MATVSISQMAEKLRASIEAAKESRAYYDAKVRKLERQLALVEEAEKLDYEDDEVPRVSEASESEMVSESDTSRLSRRWRDFLVSMADGKGGYETRCSPAGVMRYFQRIGVADITQRKVRLQLGRMARAGYLKRVDRGKYEFGARGIAMVETQKSLSNSSSS